MSLIYRRLWSFGSEQIFLEAINSIKTLTPPYNNKVYYMYVYSAFIGCFEFRLRLHYITDCLVKTLAIT